MPPLKQPRGRRVVAPLHASPAPASTDIDECITGARLLGFVPSPQQERFFRIAQARNADRPRYRRMALTEPRRSGKTDGELALVVGRCVSREDYHVAWSAQTGAKGRKRFLDYAARLERWDPCPRPKGNDPGCQREHVHYRVYRSNGGEAIEWANGSSLHVLPPDPENYRSDEYALIILDEAQEVEEDEAASELLGGVTPTMDTVPDSQLIVAGTAGKRRSGLLWLALERGRAGAWGILEYAAPLEADPTDEQTWINTHPGIGTLTDLETIRERFDDNSLVDFQREYLGQWPADSTVSAIDPEQWERARADFLERPRRVGLAFDVTPDGSTSGLACAWRDDDGVAYVELLAFRAGVSWLPAEAHRVAREARVALAYDVVGANTNVADSVHRRRPTVKTLGMRMADMQGAAQRIVSELAAGTLKHFDQKDLNLAAAGANWRHVTGESARLFGHKASAHSIVPLTSAALALWAFDKQAPARRRSRVIRPTEEAA